MVGLLLSYSADSSSIDTTRLNEAMLKVLKREITMSDSSDNDESLSPSSPLTSAGDSDPDEIKFAKSPFQSPVSYIPKFQRKKVI
jgi:hypothetical protein